LIAAWLVATAAGGGLGCRSKASAQQCNELLERYAELVVRERFPDAGQPEIEAERARELAAAKSDDQFKNCRSEVQPAEHACAIRATSPDALIKCLE